GPSSGLLGCSDVTLGLPAMCTPTNCYLVSLVLADLLVLVAMGLPSVSDSLAGHWVYGHASCRDITYFQYLGINFSSCSILALTVERCITVCHPVRAQTVCTVARAKRAIVGIWGATALYCLLWPFLVDLNVGEGQRLECSYKVPPSLYLPICLPDFAGFFLMPLLVASVPTRSSGGPCSADPGGAQTTRMLAMVVLLFTVQWTPYRMLVLLSSFLARLLLDLWFLLFCHMCVYADSAISPVLYSLMSRKFRAAFRALCRCGVEKPQSHA
uniref:Thyrotropin-releasing hormone receptor n=1 Tax=Chinchilla lanigera TaxID=34839 RepID=A0A8C2UKB8_CHILA